MSKLRDSDTKALDPPDGPDAEASEATEAMDDLNGRAVLDALQSLSSSLDLVQTVDRALAGVKSVVDYDRVSLFVRDRERGGAVVCRRTKVPGDGAREAPKPDLEKGLVARAFKTGHASLSGGGNLLPDADHSGMVAPLLGGGGRVMGAFLVESHHVDTYRDRELDNLMSFSRAAAPAIERALLFDQLGSDRRLSGEIEIARQVLTGLLPSEAPKLEGFDIAAIIEPAFEVGGDYYDYIPLGNDRWALAMADVSGKGAPAALVVAAMRATLYALAKRELALRAIIQRANEFIHASTGPRAKYVTLFYAVLDAHARRFLYINAGHLPPIVLRQNGEVELLRSGGFPLGFFDNPRYFEQFVQLRTGDMVCLYTDGITEASDASDEEYGRTRLVALLREQQKASASASAICRAVLRDVTRHSDGAPADDATLLIVRAV